MRLFSGRTMRLTSAVALGAGRANRLVACRRGLLHVRPLSEDFIHTYLDAEWPAVGGCVGVFRMEGRGRDPVRGGRGRSFHHPGHAADPAAGRAARTRADAVMTSRYAEVIGDPDRPVQVARDPSFLARSPGDRGRLSRHAGHPRRIGRLSRRTPRRSAMWRGCNVTMPLKLDALPAGRRAYRSRHRGRGRQSALSTRRQADRRQYRCRRDP